jgi:hypothetical protein
METLHSLFVRPMTITGIWRLGMLVPLALSISIVHKTVHCRRLASIPFASLKLCFMIVAGMLLIGGALLAIFQIWA